MRAWRKLWVWAVLVLVCAGRARAEIVKITILQLNDVYEIMPINHDAVGGLARVAALRQELLRENPNTITIIAGDFFGPSTLGTAVVDGKPLAGRQMVATLNALRLDYATFGNHEFDLEAGPFFERLREAEFRWVASNVDLTQPGPPYPKVQVRSHDVYTARAPQSGAEVRVGLIGLTFNLNFENGAPKKKLSYAEFRPTIEAARKLADDLKPDMGPKVEILVALTHLPLEKDPEVDPASSYDLELGAAVPKIDLILGGHEHEAVYRPKLTGEPPRPPIFKADANARTVYVHKISYDTAARKIEKIDSTLKPIAADSPAEPGTAAVAQAWEDRAFHAFEEEGLQARRTIATVDDPLDGREAEVRTGSTRLTVLVGRAMLKAAESAPAAKASPPVLAVYNSGTIRIDDIIAPGPVTEYDVKRILPYGGQVVYAKVTGTALIGLLTKGLDERKKKSGGYLQAVDVRRVTDKDGTHWEVEGVGPIKAEGRYPIVFNDYLLRSADQGFNAPPDPDPDRTKSPPRVVGEDQQVVGDLQRAVIAYLEAKYPPRDRVRPEAPTGGAKDGVTIVNPVSPPTPVNLPASSPTGLAPVSPPPPSPPAPPPGGIMGGSSINTITIHAAERPVPASAPEVRPLPREEERRAASVPGQSPALIPPSEPGPAEPTRPTESRWLAPSLERFLVAILEIILGVFGGTYAVARTVLKKRFDDYIRSIAVMVLNNESERKRAQQPPTAPGQPAGIPPQPPSPT